MSEYIEQHLQQASQALDQCLLRDRPRIKRLLDKIRSALAANKPVDEYLEKLASTLEHSREQIAQRQAFDKTVTYPENLPVAGKITQIRELLEKHQVVIVAGETGSGKTTQLPKLCLDMGRGIFGRIGHTQPRRIAARNAAVRLSEELDTSLGDTVGYQVRFNDAVSDGTRIKVMTDGILLSEIEHDRLLLQYDTLIIDEAHERSLNIDFLLGYLKGLLKRRDDLKLIVTSATIDVDSFSRYFDEAPVMQVEGRSYPVEVRYHCPLERSESGLELETDKVILAELETLLEEQYRSGSGGGDVLVFLPTEKHIRQTAKTLRRANLTNTEITPLYGRLPLAEQNKIFAQHRGTRVVLATNVAETSLTVPGIRYVIDTGTARVSRYSYRSKVQRLPIEPVSQASANQRAGRCGRVQDGICIRLYSEEDFLNRREFTEPEILRTNLASVILKMLSLGLGDIYRYPFIEAPEKKLVNDGFSLLQQLEAVDERKHLTRLGKSLARLPLDPRLAAMLLAAKNIDSLRELLVIVSFLSVQDPRERPPEKQQAADEAHKQWRHEQSDFMAILALWQHFEQQRQDLSNNQLRKYCQQNYLSLLRMREWREVHHQLRLACRDLGFRENRQAASYKDIHSAIIAGMLDQLGSFDEKGWYRGARNRRFRVFPGSAQYKSDHKWLVVAQFIETEQLFGHTVAKIEPDWVLPYCKKLAKKQYFSPFWQTKAGRVSAWQQISLFGLVLVEKQAVHYGPIDEKASREILIREALVHNTIASGARTYRGDGEFMRHNQQLYKELAALEDQVRRRDIVVDEQTLYHYYDNVVPDGIVTLKQFEKWRRQAEKKQHAVLFLRREQLLLERAAALPTQAQFPKQLAWEGERWSLTYRFEPGHVDDGVTITVTIEQLAHLPGSLLDWLVPGMLRDKCIELVKTLPKAMRKKLVPVPEFVDQCLLRLEPSERSLVDVLAELVKNRTGTSPARDDWQPEQLDEFFHFNIHLVDDNRQLLERGRDLKALRDKYRDYLQATVKQSAEKGFEKSAITRWDFGDLPEYVMLEREGRSLKAFPALVDDNESVTLSLFASQPEADLANRRGLARLFLLTLPQQRRYLKKQFFNRTKTQLALADVYPREQLVDDACLASCYACFLEGRDRPKNQGEFSALCDSQRSELVGVATALDKLLDTIADHYHELSLALKGLNRSLFAEAIADIKVQLKHLLGEQFLLDTPLQALEHYPRYLQAIAQRLQKLKGQAAKDKSAIDELQALQQPFDELCEKEPLLRQHEEAQALRWMFEEWRVSLFAQSLGTQYPVSRKRVERQWQKVVEIRF